MEESIANQKSNVSKILGRMSEWWRRMEEAGLSFDDLQLSIDDSEMRRRLVRFWKAGAYETTISQKRAREIMGQNFLGIEEVIQHFGVQFAEKEIAQLAEIPFTEGVLRECKNTHILVAGYPLSIIDIRDKASNLFYSQDWYDNEKFARKEKADPRWYLIRKDIVHNSTSKTCQEQTSLLSGKEEVPRGCELVYTIILYYLTTKVRLFEHLYGRCQDVSSDGSRVDVGGFGSDGLHVSYDWDGYRYDGVGLSSARKVQS